VAVEAPKEVAEEVSVLRFNDYHDGGHAELELPSHVDPLRVNDVYATLVPKMLGRPGGFIQEVVALSDTKIRVTCPDASRGMIKSFFRETLLHLDLPPLAQL
jgi:hypothetical protein